MNSREVVLITGKTGSGKSVFFRDLILQKRRFILFDTVKEYRNPANPFPALFINDFPSLIEYLRQNKSGSFRIVFDCCNPFQRLMLKNGQEITACELLCKIVYDCLADVTLGIEELGKHETRKELAPNMYNIICLGRHKAISLYATTQRSAQISTDVKAQVNRLVAFRQHLPNDIAWIGDCIGNPQEAETLRTLGDFTWPGPMEAGKHYKEYVL